MKLKSFIHPFQPKSSEGVPYTADWSDCYVRNRDSIIYVEVPLHSSSYDKVQYNGKELDVTSRLLVEYKKKTGKYDQTIVTKIWNNGTPDLKGRTIGDYDINSFCFISNVDGHIISNFEISDGIILPISINSKPDTKINNSDQLLMNNITLSMQRAPRLKPETKISNSYCIVCGNLIGLYNFSCRRCGVGNLTCESDYREFFAHMAAEISILTSHVVFDVDCYGHCKSFLNKLSPEALSRAYSRVIDYSLLEAFYNATYGFSQYYIHNAEELFISTRVFYNTIFSGGIFYNVYTSQYFTLCVELDYNPYRYKEQLRLLYYERVSEVCHHPTCALCEGCLVATYNGSNCRMCTHEAPECKICPWCMACSHIPNPMTNCEFCPDAALHLLRYQITTRCHQVTEKFEVADAPYLLSPFSNWESVESACKYISATQIGANLWMAINTKFTLDKEFMENRGSMDYSNKVLTLSYSLLNGGNPEPISATLFHELFHYKQFMDCGDYAHAIGNKEVEAKMAQVIYCNEVGIPDNIVYEPGEIDFIDDCRNLTSCIGSDGAIYSWIIDSYNMLYFELLDHLYSMGIGYSSYIDGDNSIKTLKTIL